MFSFPSNENLAKFGLPGRSAVSWAAEPASRAEIRTNRGGASLLPGTIIVEKLSSYPAKSKMHLHFLFPSVALRILLVTKSAAFSDFSVGLRMFF